MSWSRGADDGNGTGRLPTVGGGGNLYPLQHALAYLPNHDHWLDIVSATFPMLKLNVHGQRQSGGPLDGTGVPFSFIWQVQAG